MTAGAIEPAYAAAMPAPQGGALPTGMEWQALERMANTLADSDIIPYRLKRKPADVAVILLAAREYGVPPIMALSKLPVVNGTPAPMGELMVALILRAGHYIAADFRTPEGEKYRGGPITPGHYGECRYRRRDWDKADTETIEFSIDEAITAGLIQRIDDQGHVIARTTKTKNGQQVEEVGPWEQYTPNMARWRAVANAGRLAFADVLMGLSYLPEELGAIVDADGAPIDGVIDHQPARTATTGTLEQRTAQESAARLEAYSGDPAFLDRILEHAQTNGYSTCMVSYRGLDLPFVDAVAQHREFLSTRVVDQPATDPGTVDADVVDEQPAAAAEQEPAADAPSAPPAAEPASTQHQGPDAFPASQGDPFGETSGERSVNAALQLARDTLTATTSEELRALYKGAGNYRMVDVLEVLTDDDLDTLGIEPPMERCLLGNLLMTVAKYIEKHNTAVRDNTPPQTESLFDEQQ